MADFIFYKMGLKKEAQYSKVYECDDLVAARALVLKKYLPGKKTKEIMVYQKYSWGKLKSHGAVYIYNDKKPMWTNFNDGSHILNRNGTISPGDAQTKSYLFITWFEKENGTRHYAQGRRAKNITEARKKAIEENTKYLGPKYTKVYEGTSDRKLLGIIRVIKSPKMEILWTDEKSKRTYTLHSDGKLAGRVN